MPEEVLGINSALQNYSSYSCDSAAETGIFLHSRVTCWFRLVQQPGRGGTLSKEKPSLGTGSPSSWEGNFRCAPCAAPVGWDERVIIRAGWFSLLWVKRESFFSTNKRFLGTAAVMCVQMWSQAEGSVTEEQCSAPLLSVIPEGISATLGIQVLFINVLERINTWLTLVTHTLQREQQVGSHFSVPPKLIQLGRQWLIKSFWID